MNASAENWLDKVKWDANGLVPVIAQEIGSNDVLMFAWMNRYACMAGRSCCAGRSWVGLDRSLARRGVRRDREV